MIKYTHQRFFLVVIACFFVANGILSFLLLNHSQARINKEKHTIELMLSLEQINKTVVKSETAQRGYILTEERQYLNPYHQSIEELPKLFEQVEQQLIAFNRSDFNLVNIKQLIDKKMTELKKSIELVDNGEKEQALKALNSEVGFELMRSINIEIDNINRQQIDLISKANIETGESLWVTLLFILPTNLIGVIFIVIFMVVREKHEQVTNFMKLSLLNANQTLEARVEERTLELTEKSDALERSNQELEDFAYVASHDLQEPLRKIQAFSDRLSSRYSEQLDEKGADYLERMKSASIRMSRLIEDLLVFSRVNARELDRESINLNLLFNEVQQAYDDVLEETNTHITLESKLPKIEGEYSQLYQVFMNLIGNSVKYRNTAVNLQIDISSQLLVSDEIPEEAKEICILAPDTQYQAIIISDNGIGFEMQFAEKIFTMFQRLHGRNEYKGTGIGLAICRKIIERHGGGIFVKSATPNQGATFVVYLPITENSNE